MAGHSGTYLSSQLGKEAKIGGSVQPRTSIKRELISKITYAKRNGGVA
jgi:hypothetical protein